MKQALSITILALASVGSTSLAQDNRVLELIRGVDQQAKTLLTPNILETNTWFHFAAVSGSGGMKLYVNGVLRVTHRPGLRLKAGTRLDLQLNSSDPGLISGTVVSFNGAPQTEVVVQANVSDRAAGIYDN